MCPDKFKRFLILFFLSLFFLNLKFQEDDHNARVKFVIGQVEVQSEQQTEWRTLRLDSRVMEGDRIKTSLNSRVEVSMPDGTVLKINENTIFDVNEIKIPQIDNEDKMKFTVWAGNIWARFTKIFSSRQEREIESPSAVVSIRGTTIEMNVDQNQNTLVRVEEGLVSVRSKEVEGEVTVSSNQETYVERGKAPTQPSGFRPQQSEQSDAEFSFTINLPRLVYTDPAVLNTGIALRGKVPPGAQLFAENRPIPVTPDGSFDATIPVQEGLNTINLSAISGENKQSRAVKVYVNTKAPDIRLSTPLVTGFYNRRDYSLSGGVFDLTPGDKIRVFINNEEVADILGRGSFNRTIILKEGMNNIRVIARDRSGNTKEIAQNLFLDTAKPILTVTEPAEPIHVRVEPPPPPGVRFVRIEQNVRGLVVDPQPSSGIKRITVNGKEIQPNSDGSFVITIPVKKGDNRLNFMVEDLAGNIMRDNSRIIRVP
jgi:hypothetical protein